MSYGRRIEKAIDALPIFLVPVTDENGL